MTNRKKLLKNDNYSEEAEELRERLKSFAPETELGRNLVKLSRKNLENDIVILDADEIVSELGRPSKLVSVK